ncbi:MAG: hypothetical protein E6962_14060 [Escherichia coli]|nr:hypothetical protein [Escherichia coli]
MTGSQVIDAEEDRHKLVVEYKDALQPADFYHNFKQPTLQKWCGSENPQPRRDCQACDWHRLCPHARQETPDSVLCAGYQAFYSYSAPHMRVMRDLIKQHRSPMELMTMLR